jgi:hypothetical protein
LTACSSNNAICESSDRPCHGLARRRAVPDLYGGPGLAARPRAGTAIRAGIDIARAETLSAGRWPNPRLIVDRESVAGITEYLTMVAQPLPVTGGGVWKSSPPRRSWTRAPLARTTSCGGLARICVSPVRIESFAEFLDKVSKAVEILWGELPECCKQHVVPAVRDRHTKSGPAGAHA